jgi:hypothetical protein
MALTGVAALISFEQCRAFALVQTDPRTPITTASVDEDGLACNVSATGPG